MKWFDRKFEFATDVNTMPCIIERLSGTSIRLIDKVRHISRDKLTTRYDNKWSVQENIGHLVDLEPLWQGRLQDILNGESVLRDTDLQNKKTDRANHHKKSIDVLLDEFHYLRRATLDRLEILTPEDILRHALHPRLKCPMRMVDLFQFVADHDDHHLARISELNRILEAQPVS
jgi:uncharacterized damage-inducible protein DinB